MIFGHLGAAHNGQDQEGQRSFDTDHAFKLTPSVASSQERNLIRHFSLKITLILVKTFVELRENYIRPTRRGYRLALTVSIQVAISQQVENFPDVLSNVLSPWN